MCAAHVDLDEQLTHTPQMSSSTPSFPFAFIGAGDASYFEWAEVHVRFTRSPNEDERARIAATVPPPIADLSGSGPLLSASSEQGVGRHIRAAYSGKKLVALTTTSRFSAAAPSAVESFNDDIERWLRAAHDVVPVLVAYRSQDAEAGGTELSSWHTDSVRHLARVLTTIIAEQHTADGWLAQRLLWAAEEAQIDIDAVMRDGVTALEARREAEADAARAEQAAREDATMAQRLRVLDERTAQSSTTWLSGDARDGAIAALASALPTFHKRLARFDRALVRLRAGASPAAIDDVERALGLPLLPEHRALLLVCDGGIVGDVVLCGTAAGGAAGRHSIVESSSVFSTARGRNHIDFRTLGEAPSVRIATHPRHGTPWAATVATRGHALLMARERNGKPDCFLQGSAFGAVLKSSKSLDKLLDFTLKPPR